MTNRILVLAFAISITACGGGDLPDTATATAASTSPMSTSTPLSLYADTYSLYTGGVANLSASGGSAPYTFTVDNAALGSVSGAVFTSVRAGTVNVTVRDGAGATAQLGISITDAPSTTTTVAAPVTKPMYRFRHDNPLYHHFTPDQAGDAGYASNPEGIQYRVYANQETGSVPLYGCRMANYLQIRFSTLDINCEGQGTTNRVVLGYAMPQNSTASGHTSLWRHAALQCPFVGGCYYAIFESLNETPPAGYSKVGVAARVPVQ